MKIVKLPSLLLAAGAFAFLAASCSSDPKNEDYPATALKSLPVPADSGSSMPDIAYKDFRWTDSIAQAEASLKDVHPWTGDPFGVYTRAQIVNGVLLDVYEKTAPPPKDGKALSPEEKLEAAKKLLSKKDQGDFIIRRLSFASGKSDVTIYWFEINDPKRPSRFVDQIVWSKMCMVRIFHHDPPLPFPRVYAAQEERFGKPETKEFKDSAVWNWYKKQVEPRVSYHPEKENLWRKGGLTVALYDWRDPDEETGRSELIIRNDAVFKEFEDKIRERASSSVKERADKVEASAKQALSY